MPQAVDRNVLVREHLSHDIGIAAQRRLPTLKLEVSSPREMRELRTDHLDSKMIENSLAGLESSRRARLLVAVVRHCVLHVSFAAGIAVMEVVMAPFQGYNQAIPNL